MEVDGLKHDVAEDQFVDAVLACGPQCNALDGQGLGSLDPPLAEAEAAVGVDRPHDVAGGIVEGLDPLPEGSRARLVTLDGHSRVQRVMWPVMVVAIAPGIEGLLGFAQVLEAPPLQQLEVESAVEAFVLACRASADAGAGCAMAPPCARSARHRTS